MLENILVSLIFLDLEMEHKTRNLLDHTLRATTSNYCNVLVLEDESGLKMKSINLVNVLLPLESPLHFLGIFSCLLSPSGLLEIEDC